MKPVSSKLREIDGTVGSTSLLIGVSLKASEWSSLPILLLSIVLISGCGKQGASQSDAPSLKPQATSIRSDEYAVYSALLKHLDKEDNKEEGLRRFIVRDSTQHPLDACIPVEVFRRNNQVMTSNWQQAINDLKEKQGISFRLSEHFDFQNSYAFIADNKFNTITDTSNKDGFLAFRQEHPDIRCIVSFSRVGFDGDKLKAVVYSESWCGPLSGTGDYYTLTLVGGFWKIDKNLNCWVS